MKKQYILYNPKAGNGNGGVASDTLDVLCFDSVKLDITKLDSYDEFFRSLAPSDKVILCGGDGTLNRFVNDTRKVKFTNSIYYFPAGNGNAFARDLGLSSDEFPKCRMNDYLRDLPMALVNGEACCFLNNVGFGIDGYCSGEGERLQHGYRDEKKVNYTLLAIRGLLRHFTPRKAVVTVDGVSHTFEKVWFASTMNGRFYGGGMMAAPNQDRLDPDKTLSLVVMHGAGRLKALCIFLSIFKGKHLRHKKHVVLLTGHEISVEFDRPTPLQMDGEVLRNVQMYRAVSAKQRIFEREAVNERENG